MGVTNGKKKKEPIFLSAKQYVLQTRLCNYMEHNKGLKSPDICFFSSGIYIIFLFLFCGMTKNIAKLSITFVRQL